MEQNSPAVFLCAVGGPASSEPLKEQTHGRGLGMFTLQEKSRGGQQRPKTVRVVSAPASMPPSEPLGGEKNHLSPHLIIASERRGETNDSAE